MVWISTQPHITRNNHLEQLTPKRFMKVNRLRFLWPRERGGGGGGRERDVSFENYRSKQNHKTKQEAKNIIKLTRRSVAGPFPASGHMTRGQSSPHTRDKRSKTVLTTGAYSIPGPTLAWPADSAE